MALEWIFRKSPEAFKILYEEIFEEVKEAYFGEHQFWENIYRDEFCCNVLFRHMLQLNHPSTVNLLREITGIIESGQCMFLERAVGREDVVVRHIQSGLLSGEPKAIELLKETAWIMLYIYNVYERGNRLLEDIKVDLAMTNLNLAKPPITMHAEKSLRKVTLRNMPLAVKMKHHLDEKIIGQDVAKKMVCIKIQHFVETNGEVREPVLLEGPTGCGKTYIFQCLKECEELQELTFFNYCASDITPNGFQGDDLRDVFKRYKQQQRRNKESNLDYSQGLGIIFLDEIDNLIGTANYDASGQDVNALIVSQLLTALAGTQEYEDVDTSKILFICAGAFEELENDRETEKEKERKRIGFGRCNEAENSDKREIYNLKTELEKKGVSRQFLGRVNIIHMDRLTREDFLHILLDSKHGILTKKQNLFRKNNLTLTYDDQVVEKLIDNLDEKMGARGLQTALDDLIGTSEYDMIEGGFDEMYLHVGMFEGEPPILRCTDRKTNER